MFTSVLQETKSEVKSEEGDDEDGSLLEIEIFPSTWSNSKSEASKCLKGLNIQKYVTRPIKSFDCWKTRDEAVQSLTKKGRVHCTALHSISANK